LAIIKKFEDIVNEQIKIAEENYIENQSLIQTRDYLLPKLISGEVEL
jgi:hypothetical protein